MFYELRLYTVVPGRIDVAYERFGKYLPELFERHGIRNVGCWTVSAGANGPMFAYMMSYRDLGERQRQWESFYQDEAWYEIRARTQGSEEATERYDIYFLKSSAIATFALDDPRLRYRGTYDLIISEVLVGHATSANGFLGGLYLPLLEKAGAEVLVVADVIAGPSLPKMAMLLRWRDVASRQAGWKEVNEDRGLYDALAEQRRTLGRSVLGRRDTYLLEAAPFVLAREVV